MNQTIVTYFDGKSAQSHEVKLELRGAALSISADTIKNCVWEYEKLKSVQAVRQGTSLRLTCDSQPGARLVVPAGLQADKIIDKAPHLSSRYNLARVARIGAWTGGSIAAALLVFYLVLNLAPKTIAKIMPEKWRQTVGVSTEKTLVKKARRCIEPLGQRALLKLASKVAAGTKTPPDFSVRVYDMAMVNAFAVPGGRMVLTRGLIKAAKGPGEIAGVFAHELGHVAKRHSEAAMVRIMGIQLLVSLATGGGDGETIGNLAGIATFLSYSREAEQEADKFAQEILTKTKIDTAGLIAFFKRMQKKESKHSHGKLGKALSMLSTHPGTNERIRKLKTLPKNEVVEVLSPLEWKALKNICNQKAKPTQT